MKGCLKHLLCNENVSNARCKFYNIFFKELNVDGGKVLPLIWISSKNENKAVVIDLSCHGLGRQKDKCLKATNS